jgi:hypothetical protein
VTSKLTIYRYFLNRFISGSRSRRRKRKIPLFLICSALWLGNFTHVSATVLLQGTLPRRLNQIKVTSHTMGTMVNRQPLYLSWLDVSFLLSMLTTILHITLVVAVRSYYTRTYVLFNGFFIPRLVLWFYDL